MMRLAIAGFGIWLIATMALRVSGERLLDPDGATRVLAILALSSVVMFYLPRRLFRRFSIPRAAFERGAIALVAPGMLLDTIATIWFPQAYPNIRPGAAGLFGGWLLFCNVVALISAATCPPEQM